MTNFITSAILLILALFYFLLPLLVSPLLTSSTIASDITANSNVVSFTIAIQDSLLTNVGRNGANSERLIVVSSYFYENITVRTFHLLRTAKSYCR